MQRLINFLFKHRYFILFLLLETFAVTLTVQYHSYHRSKFISSANFVSGKLYENMDIFREYIRLKSYNERFARENARLRAILTTLTENKNNDIKTDSALYDLHFEFIPAKVVNNSYIKRNNYLTLNKGRKDRLAPGMGIVNDKGIIGIVENVSKNYATVISILHRNSKINARLKKNRHFGTLSWDGKDYNTLQLDDIPRQAVLKTGDTIVTGGKSVIFPEGIPIGTIQNFELDKSSTYFTINVSLFNDMSNIGYVYAVISKDKEEVTRLEQKLYGK